MGTINSTFTVAELMFDFYEETENAKKLTDFINSMKYKDFVNLCRGNNDYWYLTISPSGSKNGRKTQQEHEEEMNKLINKIYTLTDYRRIEKVTTSKG